MAERAAETPDRLERRMPGPSVLILLSVMTSDADTLHFMSDVAPSRLDRRKARTRASLVAAALMLLA